MTTDSLFDHIRKQIPAGFITYLAQRQPQVYPEAAATAFSDPRWTEAEGRMLVGDVERAIFESISRKAAEKYKLRWENVDHIGKNSSCVHIYAGNVNLTTHRVACPGYFVRPCESRKQDAAVNEFMDGYVLEGSLCAPLPTLSAAKEIRLYILQGSALNEKGERESFIELAAPDSALARYQWIRNFGELQQAYLADARETDHQEQEREILPKLKRNRKLGAE